MGRIKKFRCKRCQRSLVAGDFSRNKWGLMRVCRECWKARLSAGRKGKGTGPRVKAEPVGPTLDTPTVIRQVFRAIAEGILQAIGEERR